jgi:hypothetical protein
MKEMGWSWKALQETPPYVQRYCMDISGIRRKCEADHVRRRSR